MRNGGRFAALMIDIRDSRKLSLEARQSAQEELHAAMECTNAIYGPGIEKPLMFSGGDEIQGLFAGPSYAFLAFRMLTLLCTNISIRGGIGIGGWETRISSDLSTEQDGSAYHEARKAINEAKKEKNDSLLVFQDGNNKLEVQIPAALSIDMIKDRSKSQKAVSRMVEMIRPLIPIGDENQDIEPFKVTELQRGYLWQDFSSSIPGDYVMPVVVGRDLTKTISSIDRSMAGISYALSPIVEQSRQGLDKALAKGKVLLERRAAAYAAYRLTEVYSND